MSSRFFWPIKYRLIRPQNLAFSPIPVTFAMLTTSKPAVMKLSHLSETLIGSEIVKLGGEIREKIRQGERIYNFTVGDFDPSIFPIPKELEDAAMVDGLTRFGAFVKMVIPISLSGILTVVIFTFTLVTQEFVYALTFISPESQQMVGVGVPIVLVRGDVYYWGALMAACLIASLPIAFLYNLFLDRFIAGFTVGAVKG